jgi:3-oxoacyl-(acyl-carrier-protein) synthase
MKIYLTHSRTACTTHTDFLGDLASPQTVHWFPETYRRVGTGMFYVPHLVADKVLDQDLAKTLRANPVDKTAFVLAAGNTNFAGINPRDGKKSCLSYVYKFLPLTLTQVYAGRVAQAFDANDMIVTDTSACASSLKVMMDVQNLIKFYGFSRVIVLAVEDQVANSTLDFFWESKAILSEEEAKIYKPSAFDSTNYGFHVGQGAALAVFEVEGCLSGSPIAELKGAYSAGEEINNAIGQRADGQGFRRAIHGAAACANLSSLNEIGVVKTHGTGTKSNNQAEGIALREELPEFVATSYKAKIGHTMGVSGLLESILLFEDMKQGYVPAIANRTEKDDVFLSDPVEVPEGYVLSLAAGMGNIYSAAIFDTKV